jgi:hypothetical protein
MGIRVKMLYQVKVVITTIVIFLLFAVSQAIATIPYFIDISESSGVGVSHSSGTFAIGQAWIDVNNDGLLDIYVTDQLGPNHLLINQGNETFLQLPVFDNLKLENQACVGVSVADFDNDGWDDIYVNCHGDNHLFKNNYGQSFEDVTLIAGVNDINNSQVSAWADINNDGWLDLYVVNYNNGQSAGFGSNVAKDSFYLSNGDATFTNINIDFDPVNLNKPGLAVTFFDYDNDGDQDLYVVIDRFHGNVLWQNEGPATDTCGIYWCFKDVSVAAQADAHVYGMGIATGDIDLDGDMDMYFTSIGQQYLLINQVSQGSATFVDVSYKSVLNVVDVAGWGTLFFDYDNDSYLDAMIATYGLEIATAERLFKGNGDTTFSDVTADSGMSDLVRTEGIAFGDMNNDGLLDLLKGNNNSGYKLYKNSSNPDNNWIKVNLIGYESVNRNAIGTRVRLLTSDNKVLLREVTGGDSRGSTNQRILHFGLGTAHVTSLEIYWTDGTVDSILMPTINIQHKFINQAGNLIFSNGFD